EAPPTANETRPGHPLRPAREEEEEHGQEDQDELIFHAIQREQRRQRGAGSRGTNSSAKKATKTPSADDDGAPFAVPGMKTVTTKPLVRAGRTAFVRDELSEWDSLTVTVVKVLSYDSVLVERPNADGSGMDRKEVNPNTLECHWEIGKEEFEDCPICLEKILVGKNAEGRFARHALQEPCERPTEISACFAAPIRATIPTRRMWRE
ncbi:hypothetical protein THAOC_24938, partial [Thalassiosira oceanica]